MKVLGRGLVIFVYAARIRLLSFARKSFTLSKVSEPNYGNQSYVAD